MKTIVLFVSTLVLISWVSLSSSKENTIGPSFSYEELESAEKVPIPSVQYIEASDKTRLAYREYTPEKIKAILIFYHGGGTYSAGGYQHIGNGLSNRFNILFVQNAIYRTHGNSKAVFFNYSEEVLQNTKNIAAITVNMSNAQTPTSPKEQLQELNLPTAVWIGKEDEVLDANKVISFFKENNPESFTKILEGEKHLSILLTVSDPIGNWIHDIVK